MTGGQVVCTLRCPFARALAWAHQLLACHNHHQQLYHLEEQSASQGFSCPVASFPFPPGKSEQLKWQVQELSHLISGHHCCHMRSERGVPANRISHVHMTWLMLPLKVKPSQLLVPPMEPGEEALLRPKLRVGQVISHHGEVLSLQVAPPQLQVVPHCKHTTHGC